MKQIGPDSLYYWNTSVRQFKNTTCLVCPHNSIDMLCDVLQCTRSGLGFFKFNKLVQILVEEAHEGT